MDAALQLTRPEIAFQSAMADTGIICPDVPIADGVIHRFKAEGDRKPNSAYVLHLDGIPGGAFWCFKRGIKEGWSTKTKETMSPNERQAWSKRMGDAKKEREKEQEKIHAEARARARDVWASANAESACHPYIKSKQVSTYGIRQRGETLVIPMRDSEGVLHSLQFIGGDGKKRFLTGGRVNGCYCSVGSIKERLYLCEGYATGATIHEATNEAVAIAFYARNLLPVSNALRKKYSDLEIIIAADNDHWTEGNPGLTKANEAAQQVNGRVVVPRFESTLTRPTDFNDLYILEGTDAVRTYLAGDSGDNGERPVDAVPHQSPVDGDISGTAGETGFSCNSGGVWYTDEEGRRHWICSKLQIVALTRDKHSAAWGRLLKFSDPDRRVHSWACPMELLAGDGADFRRILLSMGLQIAPSPTSRKCLTTYVQIAKTDQRAVCVDRTGWHDTVFVLPDNTLGESEEKILLQTAAEPPRMEQSGTLEGWRSKVGILCRENTRAIFAVSCAFAANLLAITGDESGGINFVGSSSIGKTTLLRVACSVMGAPEYLHRWRATSNGLEAIAQTHNDMLLILDELGQVDAREAGHIAYMLANGSGKHRARRDGLAKQAATWRLLFLSAGEIGLADHMLDAGKRARAGQEMRLADVPADTESGNGVFNVIHNFDSGAAFADRLIQSVGKYYGTAGRVYISQLVTKPRADLLASIDRLRGDFLNDLLPENADGQARRIAGRFALIAAGGELATAMQITGWDEGDAIHAASDCFIAWLDRRGGSGSREEEEALAQVRHFIEVHGEARFSGTNSDRVTHNRAGLRRVVDGQVEY